MTASSSEDHGGESEQFWEGHYRQSEGIGSGRANPVLVEVAGPLETTGVQLADADTLAGFVAALFDGVTLAWLADPEGTRPDDIFVFVSELLTRPRQPRLESSG